MAGDIDQGLTLAEGPRFDAALQKWACDPVRGAQMVVNAPEPAVLRPTSYEEHIWLAQQQAPEAILKQVVAFRLTGALDLARLVVAVPQAERAFPDLNCRYRFDVDGELHKRFDGEQGPCLRVVGAESEAEAIKLVLDRQREVWDSETQPPFEVMVLACPRETVLAVVLHRILDEACPAAALLRAIGEAYARGFIEPVATARGADPEAAFPAPGEAAAMLPAWMCSHPDAAGLGVADSRGGPTPPVRNAATRYASRIDPREWAPAGLADASDREILARLAAQFARYLSILSGRRHVDLFVQAVPAAWIGDPAPSLARSNFLKLILDGQASGEQGFHDILAALDRAAVDAVLRHDQSCARQRPVAYVTWLGEPADILHIEGVAVEQLPFPTLESRPDLTLAIGRHSDGRIAVELTAGQQVSPHVGALLLERFCRWTADSHTALPVPGQVQSSGADGAGRPAGGEALQVEAIAALILAEFRDGLNAPELGENDDFFDHGGHSLIATRIIGRLLSSHGIEIQFNDLFSNPSAAALARQARVTATGSGAMQGTAGDGTDSAPLSLAQMSLWKAYAAFGFNEIFNLPFALDFLDEVDEAVFACAFLDVVERHAGLRSLFRRDGDEIRQEVVPIAELPRYQWFWSSRESAGMDRRDEAVRHFDLSNELPFRLRFLIDPATGRQVLSFLFHHIVLDEWSVNQMMDEIAYGYRARAAGGPPVWSDAPAPFSEFARLQNAAGVDASHLGYWADALRGAPRPRPILSRQQDRDASATAPQETSAAGGWVEFKLDQATARGLYALARQNSASLFNVVYAGITASLRWLGSLSELVVGTSASGRSNAAFFDTIGYFTTVVAHRIRFDDAMSVGELVGHVKNTINESMPYTEIPIDRVEEALGMTPGKDHIFEVFIQIHARNKLNGAFELPGGRRIAFRQVDPERHESMLGLHFEVMEETLEGERSIRVLMSYRSEHYGPAEVERITATTGAVFVLMSGEGASGMRLGELGARLAAN